jgi:hypothetical protein
MSTLAADVHTSAQRVYWGAEGCSSVQGFYRTQAVPSGESAALLVSLTPPISADNLDRIDMKLKQNVSFCNNVAWHKSGRGFPMDGLVRGAQ